jgi:hypothetical protein
MKILIAIDINFSDLLQSNRCPHHKRAQFELLHTKSVAKRESPGRGQIGGPLGHHSHQRGVSQTLWIALALCCWLEDTLGQQGSTRRRSLLRAKRGSNIIETFRGRNKRAFRCPSPASMRCSPASSSTSHMLSDKRLTNLRCLDQRPDRLQKISKSKLVARQNTCGVKARRLSVRADC